MPGPSNGKLSPRHPRAPWRRRIGAWALALVAVFGTAAAGEPPPDLLDPARDVRSLPSLVVRWTCRCNPAAVTVGPAPGGGAVYVQGYRRFFALDAATHAVLWDHELDEALSPRGGGLPGGAPRRSRLAGGERPGPGRRRAPAGGPGPPAALRPRLVGGLGRRGLPDTRR